MLIALGVPLLITGLVIFSLGIGMLPPVTDSDRARFQERSVQRGEDLRRRLGDEAAERFYALRKRDMTETTHRSPLIVGGVLFLAGVLLTTFGITH